MSKIDDEYYPTFESMGLQPCLLKAVKDLGFVIPTAIQRGCIVTALQGKDVIASALTGSGKTAAFVLPMLEWLINMKGKTIFEATRGLILTPTRELAQQVAQNARDLAKFAPEIKIGTIFGGASDKPQVALFKKKVDIIVACPGRLLDIISNHKACSLKQISRLVVDEVKGKQRATCHYLPSSTLSLLPALLDSLPLLQADKMLDMGFLDDL